MKIYINKTQSWHDCQIVKENHKTAWVFIPDLRYKESKQLGIEIKVSKSRIK